MFCELSIMNCVLMLLPGALSPDWTGYLLSGTGSLSTRPVSSAFLHSGTVVTYFSVLYIFLGNNGFHLEKNITKTCKKASCWLLVYLPVTWPASESLHFPLVCVTLLALIHCMGIFFFSQISVIINNVLICVLGYFFSPFLFLFYKRILLLKKCITEQLNVH